MTHHLDPVQEEQKKQREEKRRALERLEALSAVKIRFSRPVCFVPGWAGEEGKCWTSPYPALLSGHRPIRFWIERIVPKADRLRYVRYLRFTMEESRGCPSFLEFAPLLKRKIGSLVPQGEPIDLIGHSMGALDIIAAAALEEPPLKNPIVNCAAVASPLRGLAYGRLAHRVQELLPFVSWQPHHFRQLKNMDHDAEPIIRINSLPLRRRFLERVQSFYALLGSQDAVIGRNARLRTEGLSDELKRRVSHRVIQGAAHTASAGITQDPRTILILLQILGGLPQAQPKLNYGYLVGGPGG